MVAKPIKRNLATTGIKNKGNTCFFNASLQALLSIPEVVHFLSESTFDPSKQNFCLALQNFIVQYTKCKIVDPSSLISVLKGKIKLFDGRQQDAHSFLESLISRLSDESESMHSEKKSFFKKIFGINAQDTVKCHECGFKSSNETVSMIQYLFIKKSIQSSIDHFLQQEEQVDSGSPWECTKCKTKGVSSLSHAIKKTSNNLIVYLNRFQSVNSKNDTNLAIDTQIEINKDIFDLVATVCHSGTLSGGHYYSYCKRDHEWNEYNDSLVQKAPRPEYGDQVYILFYSKANKD